LDDVLPRASRPLSTAARLSRAGEAVQVLAPLAVIAAAAGLRLWHLGSGGLGNPFYAAAVRSMRLSAHNFVFAAFDPLATFSVDKPPLAFWLQTASTWLFGYGGFALALPQATAGIAGVLLLYAVGRRLHDGPWALAAAAMLAVVPASVLVARNNTMDTLVMALSLATLALVVQAAANDRLRPMALAGIACGLAFETKGFESFVALPAVVAYYLLACPSPWLKRLRALALFAVIATAVGLAWPTAVSLVPADQRPLVLNSDSNSEIDLALRYNGFDRLLGGDGFNPASALTAPGSATIPIGVLYGGKRGLLRVFGEFPGPLIAAAVPVALAGALVLVLEARDRARSAVAALWVLWLVTGLAVFSASRLGSPHYFESFTPALSACFAAAARAAASGSRPGRLVALAGVAGSAAYALDRLTHLGGAGHAILVLAAVMLVLAAASGAVVAVRPRRLPHGLAAAPFACLVALLFLVSAQAVRDAPIEGVQPGTVLLTEDTSRAVRFDPSNSAYSFLTGRYDYIGRTLDYLQSRLRPGSYLVGVRTFYMAAAVISQRDAPVLPLYSEFRNRPELPMAELRRLVQTKQVTYFLVSLPALRGTYPEAAAFIEASCRSNVSRAAGLAPQTGLQLLHCE
jgi:4-amino-4-deoxy-L-arabinose transferase-like glycosyltransferase